MPFAMYLPKPVHLVQVLAMLSVIWLIFCWCAWRLKLRLLTAAPVLFLSGVLAVGPDIIALFVGHAAPVVHSRWPVGTDHRLIALTGYLHAGRGGWLPIGGMLCGLAALSLVARFSAGRNAG